MTKKEIRQEILGRYIRLLVNNHYEFESILGTSLRNFDYNTIIEKMKEFTSNDYDWITSNEIEEYELLIEKL
jgi:predicted nucleotidyltransferase